MDEEAESAKSSFRQVFGRKLHMGKKRSQIERKSTVSPHWVYSLLVSTLLLAFLFIYGLGLPEGVGRIIGVGLFMFVFPSGILWLGLNPRLNLAEGATVKTSARTKKIYDWIARSIFVAVGVFFFISLPCLSPWISSVCGVAHR